MNFERYREETLGSQFPKKHKCGREGTQRLITEEAWKSFPFYVARTDEFDTTEWRHCPDCLSTLVVVLDVHRMPEIDDLDRETDWHERMDER